MKGFLAQSSDGNYAPTKSASVNACSLWVSRSSPAKAAQKVRDAFSESQLSLADNCKSSLGFGDASSLQGNADATCQALPNSMLTGLIDSSDTGVITLNLGFQFGNSTVISSISSCKIDLKARKDALANLTYSTLGTTGSNGINYGAACVLKLAIENASGAATFTDPLFNQVVGSKTDCQNLIKGKFNCNSLWARPEIVGKNPSVIWPSLSYNGSKIDLVGSDYGATSTSKYTTVLNSNSDHKACGANSIYQPAYPNADGSCALASVLSVEPGSSGPALKKAIPNVDDSNGIDGAGLIVGDLNVAPDSKSTFNTTDVKNCYNWFRNRFGLKQDGSLISPATGLGEIQCQNLLSAVKPSLTAISPDNKYFLSSVPLNPPFGKDFDKSPQKPSVFLDSWLGCSGQNCFDNEEVCTYPSRAKCSNGWTWCDNNTHTGCTQDEEDACALQDCVKDPKFYESFGSGPLLKAASGAHACGFTFIKVDPSSATDNRWDLVTFNQAREITRIRNATTGTPMVNCDPTLTPFGGGDGSPSAPFLICSVKQFQAITGKTITISGTTLNGVTTPDYSGLPSYQLTQDLDFTGQAFTPIPSFTGNFNGNGKILKGISFQESSANLTQSLGVFRQTKDAVIANLVLESVSMQGGDRVGALVGQAVSTRFLNISTKDQICGTDGSDCASVTAKSSGGISVTGKSMVGGLIGESLGGSSFDTIKIKAMVKDTADGTLVGNGSDKTSGKTDTGVGGLVGVIHNLPLPTVPVMSVFKNVNVRAQVLWSNSAVDIPNWTFTGGVIGYGSGIQMTSVRFSGLVTGVSYTGGIAGDLDTIPSGPNNLSGVSVEAQADNGVLSAVKGVSSVGGIYGGGYGIVVSDSFSSANVMATGANIGGISGAGCGNTIQRVAMFGSVFGKESVAGIDGLSCVLTVKDVIAVGSVRALGVAEAGISAGGYQPTKLTNVMSMVKISDTSAARANIAGPIGNYDSKGVYGGVAVNQFTVTNAYYQKSLNPDLTDPLQIWLTIGSGPKAVPQSQGYVAKPLLDSDLSVSGKFTGFDFTSVWVMPKSVPVSLNGGKVFPVLRSSCGKAGVVCP
jgi:hypothetical protein